jgi:hypothetical protein
MKGIAFRITIILFLTGQLKVTAQSNYLDKYLTGPVVLTEIGNSSHQVSQPRDLDFKPGTNELWVANYGNSQGAGMVIFYNAGRSNQSSQYRKDTHTGHFKIYPSAIAFGDDGFWANVNEIKSTAGPTSTFMGPALWTSDTAVFARVFQNNWVSGYPLGSHYDMLHQSPFAMGMAHDSALAYWVMDGHNGNICKYDFVMHHGPGYDDHSAGKIWRYTDVPVTRVAQVPSHMVMDKTSKWLYFIDGGSKKIKRMNTKSGAITGTLTVPSTAPEPLAGYWKVEGAVVEVLDSLSTQPCSIDYYNDRLVVSDYTTGDIYLYNTSGTFTLLGKIVTGVPGIMGIKIGPDGRIWCVNHTQNKVYRIDTAKPQLDAAITGIISPQINNYSAGFYGTGFNICDETLFPLITIENQGTTNIDSMVIEYRINQMAPISYSWSGNLGAPGFAIVNLPASIVGYGNHEITIRIVSVNGITDEISSNNMMKGSFRMVAPIAPVPFTEGFSAANFPPTGWSYSGYNPNNPMIRSNVGGFGNSTGSMKMVNQNGTMNITGQADHLISPAIDLSSSGNNVMLRFSVAHARFNTATNDRLQVWASSDCGNFWDLVYDKAGATLATAPTTASHFTPTPGQWRTDSVSLATHAGKPEVMIMFTCVSSFGNNIYVDDIYVGDFFTGIAENEPLSFRIYPVPADGPVQIDLPNEGPYEVSVRNMLGALIYQGAESGGITRIDFSNIVQGSYIVSVSDKQGRIAHRKIVRL